MLDRSLGLYNRRIRTNPNLRQKAVIADMDGSLVNVTSVLHHVKKKPKDFQAFHSSTINCPPNQQAIDFCQRHWDTGHIVLIVTARMQMWRASTVDWLDTHLPVPYDGPFHRADGDIRPDVAVKMEIYHYLNRVYDIRYACEDNPRVVSLWEGFGIPTEVVPGWGEELQ
jgi:hypothetical protein